MDPQQLIDQALQALEALKGVPGIDHGTIEQCVNAVQGMSGSSPEPEGGAGGGPPPGGDIEPDPNDPNEGYENEPPPAPPSPGAAQAGRNSFAAARQAVMEHHKRTGSLPTTGGRRKVPVKK